MSGPKSSSYRLSEAQSRALQKEAERRRQKEIKRKKILAEKETLNNLQKSISKLMTLAQTALNEVFITEDIKERMREVLSKCKQIASRCTSDQASDDLAFLESECGGIKTEVKDLKAAIDAIYSILPVVIRNERTKIEDSIAEGFGFVLTDTLQKEVNRDADIRREIDTRLDELRSLSLPQVALTELERLFQKAAEITSTDFLKNYLALDIDPFIKKCRTCAEMDYIGVRARYELLANERRIVPQDFDYSAQGITDMKAVSDTLEAELLADRERAYIYEVLESAIRDMGYKLIGDRVVVRPKNGKQIKHQLYTLHGGTAVDVTFSDNGQVAMELGGITHTNRAPTAEESTELVEDMRSFCRDYELLEKKLAERGIETSRISILPPASEYARMINADKYNLTETTTEYETQRVCKHATQYLHRGTN